MFTARNVSRALEWLAGDISSRKANGRECERGQMLVNEQHKAAQGQQSTRKASEGRLGQSSSHTIFPNGGHLAATNEARPLFHSPVGVNAG